MNFLKFQNKVLKITPLTLAQQQELGEYLRYHYIEEIKKQIKGLPDLLSKHVLDNAIEKANKIQAGRKEHAEFFFTPLGTTYALYLACQKNQPDFKLTDAYDAIDESGDDAINVISEAVGYKSGEKKTNNKPLDLEKIIKILSNEPYYHTPKEIKEMTLDDIAAIWSKTEEDKPVYTQADQLRWFQEAKANADKNKLGIWGKEDVKW